MTFYTRVTTKPGYKLLFIFALMCLVGTVEYQTELVQEKADQEHDARVKAMQASLTQYEAKLAVFYAKQVSPAAVEMARATAQAKRPRLMAAVAAVESNGTPAAKGKAGEQGAWQVIPSIHGSVPLDAAGQMDQNQRILEELLADNGGSMKQALSAYNGDSSGRYARKVMAKLSQVPK